MEESQDVNYDEVLETLINTFGNVLSKDVYLTIIESCAGDLNDSADAIASIITDGNSASINDENEGCSTSANLVDVNPTEPNMQAISTSSRIAQESMSNNTENIPSYANASQNSRPPLQLKPKAVRSTSNMAKNFWTSQIRQIVAQNESGTRILIIMRGVPGSGKSFTAKQIISAIYGTQSTQHHFTHILSTDDFFMNRGVYCFNKNRLPEAHAWNKNRAQQYMREGVSPIIIDNTNIEVWEMEPYVREGVANGYIVEVLEPNTPWARKANELVRRNTHNVPIQTIRKMLDNYENGITGAVLMRRLNCYYDHRMQPPVLRNIPRILHTSQSLPIRSKKIKTTKYSRGAQQEMQKMEAQQETQRMETSQNVDNTKESSSSVQYEKDNDCMHKDEQEIKCNNTELSDDIAEIIKALEEMEKVEEEWETGESWDDNSMITNRKKYEQNQKMQGSKPQRKNKDPRSNTGETLFPNAQECQDWSKISMFLPSWNESGSSSVTKHSSPVVDKLSRSTSIEAGDTDIPNSKSNFKIITAVTRDINESYVATKNNKIPEKWMLDKGTSTNNNELVTNNYRCQNEEQHFSSFCKLFKNVTRSDLRDIFDHCCGDVNWAVEIVLDGVENNRFGKVAEGDQVSDAEEDSQDMELCQCLSAYGILPDVNEPSTTSQNIDFERSAKISLPSLQMKKGKKETVVSEASLELKRKFEQNIVLPDSKYSPHNLKIRNIRRGDDGSKQSNNTDNTSSQNAEQKPNVSNDEQAPSTLNYRPPKPDSNTPSTSKEEDVESSDDEYIGPDEQEKTAKVNLGTEFIRQLDVLFGRTIDYPSNINLTVSMPMSILNEINALWVESLMYQLGEDAKQTEVMIKQDEEFARELAKKELELHMAGKEPAIPDFREIMDMDYALSLYFKDVAEMRNNSRPQDLAAMLSRDKLKNLFPEIPADTLSELLHAHEENFQATVEVLLMSTNQAHVLEQKDGVNKFITKRELERQQEKLAQEQKRILSEVEWPLLPKTENLDLSIVQQYRDQAETHLKIRNEYYRKAHEYVTRGMTQVATHCSEIATFHKQGYEHANSMAAATLIQYHAQNNPDNSTIDLHFLKVREAKQSMDLFLDLHINKLREVQDKSPVKTYTLYFITGRGLHSNGKPKVKPAVKKRLRERGLTYGERNPGLIQAKISVNDKLSSEVA